MRTRQHKKPYTDEERIADGQKRFEFHDENGNCVYHCYRHFFWQAHKAWKYHYGRMLATKTKLEAEKLSMRKIIEDFKAKVEKGERRRQVATGAVNFNELTFFDLDT